MATKHLTSHEFMVGYDKTLIYRTFKNVSVNNHHRSIYKLLNTNIRRRLLTKSQQFVVLEYINKDDKDYDSLTQELLDTAVSNFNKACAEKKLNATMKFLNNKEDGKVSAVALVFLDYYKKVD